MSERTWFLTRVLRIQSVLTLLVGLSWILASTSGRLAGVSWLESVATFLPDLGFYEVNADTAMGFGWVAAAIVMGLAGWLGYRHRAWENLGFAAGLFWPLLAAVFFLVGFLMGVAPNGWITTISYLNFTVPYLVLLLKRDPTEEEVSLATGELPSVRGGPS